MATGGQAVTDEKFQDVPTERCVDHPDEVIEHYCRKHHILLCNPCERLSHRSCKNVKQISEAANKLIADQKPQAVPDQLKSTLDRLTQVMDTLNVSSSLVTKIKQYTIGHRSDINIDVSGDKKDCHIYACGRLGDGTMVLCDYKNKRLKRVDPSTNKVTDHFTMEYKPAGLCCIGPDEVAVADKSNVVRIISAVKRLKPSRTVGMGQKTSVLACHGGELFAGHLDSLRIHDMSGKMLRDISLNADGELIFFDISGIAVNQAGDRVFVSDCIKGLVCMSRDGRVVFRLSNDDMGVTRAWGVTTDHQGCVMVAGWLLPVKVLQVTDEGQVVGEILAWKDGIYAPHCLYYDVDGRKLYVGGGTSRLLGFELL